jgi:hypothetical protein
MKFDPIPLRCECGCPPIRIHNVGFAPTGQLVIHWRCLACRKTMYVVKDVAQCREQAMVRMGGVGSADSEHESDRLFLESLGIQP